MTCDGFYRYRGKRSTDEKTRYCPEPEYDLVAAVLPAAGGDLEARACNLLEEAIIEPPDEYVDGRGMHPEWITRAEDVEEELCNPMACGQEAHWLELKVEAFDHEHEFYEIFSPDSYVEEWDVNLSDYRALVFRFWYTSW